MEAPRLEQILEVERQSLDAPLRQQVRRQSLKAPPQQQAQITIPELDQQSLEARPQKQALLWQQAPPKLEFLEGRHAVACAG